MELIVMILLGVCVFMFCVYFTRWVFGIDQIINLQKDILKELKSINSKKENIDYLNEDDDNNEPLIMDEELKKSLQKVTKLK
jgi:hypothetical protein